MKAVGDTNVLMSGLLWRVSGDNDLLSIKSFEGIPILTPFAAIVRIA